MKLPLEKLLPFVFFMVLLATGTVLTIRANSTATLSQFNLPSLKLDLSSLLTSLSNPKSASPSTTPTPTVGQTPIADEAPAPKSPTASPTTRPLVKNAPTITPTKSPTKKPIPPANKACLRFTVTHTDGTQSNLCYSESNYQSLQKLNTTLLSARTFYQFHLDGVARYQEEYRKTGSSIYLDAAASSQNRANTELQKINETQTAMYNIEKTGY